MTENDLLDKLTRLHSDLRNLRNRILVVDKTTLLDKRASKHSVESLTEQLERRGISTARGLDLFILNRTEWADPDTQSLVTLLVILTGDLVFDATTRIDQKIRELAYIQLQA